jgi:hypothetical protein
MTGRLISESASTAQTPGSTSPRTWRVPATGWAVLGALFIAFQLYLYTRWIVSGNATPTPVGADTAPSWMVIAVWVHIGIGAVLLVWMINHFLVNPWRQHHTITGDGLLMLAVLTTFWGDLGANYLHYWVIYPTVWPNLGSWYNFIPGWQSPNGNLQAEATAFFLPSYAIVMFGFTSIAIAAMRRAERRWAGISKLRLFFVAFAVLATLDLVLEVAWVHLGLFVYPSTISWLTLFHGHIYQFPVYESILWGASWAGLSCLRYFKNDAGLTIVERGAERITTSTRKQLVIRFLALAAAANIFLLAYNVEAALVSTQSGNWIQDISNKSYYRGGLCGPGAEYVCPPDLRH